MDLNGYNILDISGRRTITLCGEYDAKTLSEKLIYEWIPYVECDRKCYRSEYCKYTVPDSLHPTKLKEIKCGIGVDTLKNFINSTFHILEKLPKQDIENFLDGAFYLSQFVLSAEGAIGLYTNKEGIEGWGDYAPNIFGSITKLRDKLNKLAELLRNIPDFSSLTGILFVEGWSEKVFIEKLKESQSVSLNLLCEVYGGRGNRSLKRIEMLLDNYNRLGYKIFIQGDADGKNSDRFRKIIEKGYVGENCTFEFIYDFESSIPPSLLLETLHDLGEITEVELEEFTDKLNPLDNSINKKIKKIFPADLEPIKLDIAEIIAEKLNQQFFSWRQDEHFMKTELGKFIHFTEQII